MFWLKPWNSPWFNRGFHRSRFLEVTYAALCSIAITCNQHGLLLCCSIDFDNAYFNSYFPWLAQRNVSAVSRSPVASVPRQYHNCLPKNRQHILVLKKIIRLSTTCICSSRLKQSCQETDAWISKSIISGTSLERGYPTQDTLAP